MKIYFDVSGPREDQKLVSISQIDNEQFEKFLDVAHNLRVNYFKNKKEVEASGGEVKF